MDASTLRAGSTRANMQMSSKAGLKSGPTMAGQFESFIKQKSIIIVLETLDYFGDYFKNLKLTKKIFSQFVQILYANCLQNKEKIQTNMKFIRKQKPHKIESMNHLHQYKIKKLAGGMTRLPQGSKSSKQAGQSKMKTTNSERENEYVMEGNTNVTPKRLITQQMKDLAQDFQKHEQEQAEKQKKIKQSIKPQTSLMESSMRSAAQSVDKSSGSENKTSSANIKESSMMESSRRSEAYSESEEESRIKEEREKKARKAKQLTEDDKEKDVIINLQESETEILLYMQKLHKF